MKKKNINRVQLSYNSSYSIMLLFASLVALLTSTSAQIHHHSLGAKLLTEVEYERLSKTNWKLLTVNANKQTLATKTSSIVMLNNPPIGEQGPQGSCIGWAVGYAATSILAYPKFNNNWDHAIRSPSYIYNQIKMDPNDCESGAFTTTGLNLIANQGVCSYALMPYIFSDCVSLPNNSQRIDAAFNTVLSWSTLSRNNVSGIKQALDLGYPVVIAFNVYQSFDNMWNSNGVWNTFNVNETSRGGHATCIIGYDDTKQMFKVQNSWGTTGGDNGYFWVTYNLVQNNCLNEVYVISQLNQAIYPTLSGPTQICNQATYTIDNFPQGATVNWTTSNDLTVASGQNTATVNIARTYDLAINNFIRATITINGYSFVIEKTGIQIGTVNPLIKIYDARGRYELAPPYYTNTAYTIVAYGDTFSTNPFNYQWVVNQPVESGEPPLLFNGKQFSFIADSVGSYNFSLQYNGECGWSLPTSKAVYFYQNNMLLSFYPNPATDLLTVSVGYEEESISASDISTKKTIYNESYCVELWHEKYGKVKSVESNESIVQIHLQDLPRGLYAIHLKVKNKIIRKKLLQLM